MNLSTQIAKHIRDIHVGGNWTSVNLKDSLANVSWQQATTQVYGFNSIATLLFHINYFVNAVTPVLEGGVLNAKDALSFAHPPINNAADWEAMQNKAMADAEKMANLVEQLPQEKLITVFADDKYGNYYRNLSGIVEHAHYHLGQIVLIKKILQQDEQKQVLN